MAKNEVKGKRVHPAPIESVLVSVDRGQSWQEFEIPESHYAWYQ